MHIIWSYKILLYRYIHQRETTPVLDPWYILDTMLSFKLANRQRSINGSNVESLTLLEAMHKETSKLEGCGVQCLRVERPLLAHERRRHPEAGAMSAEGQV